MMLLERHISITAVCISSFCCLIVAAAALYGAGSIAALLFVFVLLQGSGFGVTSILRPVVIAEYLGRSGFGAISGAQAIPFILAFAAAPTIGALLWKIGGYDLVIIICLLAAFLGLGAFLAAAQRHRRTDFS